MFLLVGLPEPAITKPPHDDGSPEISKLVGSYPGVYIMFTQQNPSPPPLFFEILLFLRS